ncbi:MAG: UbiH/UbiF/VisC/COQ6 family ubiquinone biosynthesis hydroxylase [Pseudomonadales bacterium]
MTSPPGDSVEHYDIAIVGGGMAGLALAASLKHSALRVALVEGKGLPSIESEPSQAFPPKSDLSAYDARVSALTPASVELLSDIGAWRFVESARHRPFQAMHVWDAMGTAGLHFTAQEVDAPMLGCIVENTVTLDALYRTLQRAHNLDVYCPRTLVALRTSSDVGAVQQLDLDDGCTLQAQLVVAADGGNSQVRQLAEFDSRHWSYQQKAIVATVRTAKSHENTAWQRFLPEGPLAFLPLADPEQRLSSIVWSADTDVAESILHSDDDQFRRSLERAFESQLGAIEATSRRYCFPLQQNHATDYVKPGIALIGDAAHVIHPLAGQGVNLGLKDVDILSKEILRALDAGVSLGDELFLQRYQRRRKSDNLAMMAAVETFKRLFGSRNLPMIWLRNEGMRRVSSFAPLKQRIVRHAMGL